MIQHIFTFAALCVASVGAWAQSLTPAQQTTVRAFACADTGTARAYVLNGDANNLRAWLNAQGVFVVWRANGTEVAGLSSLNMQRLQVLAAYSGGTLQATASTIRLQN